jgi:hypothetical protein
VPTCPRRHRVAGLFVSGSAGKQTDGRTLSGGLIAAALAMRVLIIRVLAVAAHCAGAPVSSL